jgi:hypothetical protein
MPAPFHHTRRLLTLIAAWAARNARRLAWRLRDDWLIAAEQLHKDARRFRPLPGRVARRLQGDLLIAADQLDADAQRLRAALDRHGLPAKIARVWADLPRRADTAGDRLTAAVSVALLRLDRLAARLHAVKPDLLHPRRAARLAHSVGAVTAVLTFTSVAAFATMAGPHRRIPIDRMAANQRPARLQALAQEDAGAGAAPANPANLPVAATGGEGPAVPPTPATAAATRAIPANRGALPEGKGMWIYLPERAEGGNPEAIVARAKATGLTHLYVRTGTLKGGFDGQDFLNRLLGPAHAAGIRVFGWDFPYLNNIDSDVARAVAAINYLTPDGHRIDGFASDIELRSMGVNITNHTAFQYGLRLRNSVGRAYPLIATVPRPSPALVTYPFAEVVAHFDAIAPMVYWMGNDPAATVADTIAKLAPLGRPIIPVGQAYDGGPEGGPPGVPNKAQLLAFMQAADKAGAAGVSWWSWQHADAQAWDAVREAPEFLLPTAAPEALSAGQVRAYQTLLTSLGFVTPMTGGWDAGTSAVVADYQRAARLPVTGVIDGPTRDTLLTPFPPPIRPEP